MPLHDARSLVARCHLLLPILCLLVFGKSRTEAQVSPQLDRALQSVLDELRTNSFAIGSAPGLPCVTPYVV